jgi:hypothetical protein
VEFDPARKVLAALERERVRYAVFGAVALNIHGLARATQDLDIFIAPEAGNIERLRRALGSVFPDPEIENILAEDLLGEYPAIQYVPPEGDFHVDILTRLGEAFRWDDLEIERLPFEGELVNVVTPRTLYRMKRDTVRAKDRVDAEELRRRFNLEGE